MKNQDWDRICYMIDEFTVALNINKKIYKHVDKALSVKIEGEIESEADIILFPVSTIVYQDLQARRYAQTFAENTNGLS